MKSVRLSLLLALAVSCLGAGARAADGWAQLKKGMTLDQVVSTVGMPLVRSQGRGIDLWIYDLGGETVASAGLLTDWTKPRVTGGERVAQTVTPPPAVSLAKPQPLAAPTADKSDARLAREPIFEKPRMRLPML